MLGSIEDLNTYDSVIFPYIQYDILRKPPIDHWLFSVI